MAPMAAAAELIAQLGILGDMALRDYVDWVLRPRLMTLDGIAQVYPSADESAPCASPPARWR
ncbi:MAG: hypothetical protein U1E53_00825 [Dongiaceae bacterium]